MAGKGRHRCGPMIAEVAPTTMVSEHLADELNETCDDPEEEVNHLGSISQFCDDLDPKRGEDPREIADDDWTSQKDSLLDQRSQGVESRVEF